MKKDDIKKNEEINENEDIKESRKLSDEELDQVSAAVNYVVKNANGCSSREVFVERLEVSYKQL